MWQTPKKSQSAHYQRGDSPPKTTTMPTPKCCRGTVAITRRKITLKITPFHFSSQHQLTSPFRKWKLSSHRLRNKSTQRERPQAVLPLLGFIIKIPAHVDMDTRDLCILKSVDVAIIDQSSHKFDFEVHGTTWLFSFLQFSPFFSQNYFNTDCNTTKVVTFHSTLLFFDKY